MYGNSFMYSSQASIDRINNQMSELEKIKQQLLQQQSMQPQTPTNLTQNFQLAPTNRDTIRYASSLQEVERDVVLGETPYFSKDMSVVWVKSTKGDIKTYELKEIIPRDEKDAQIALLQAQIEELKKGREEYAELNTNAFVSENQADTSESNVSNANATQKSKSTSISGVSKSKARQS